MARHAKKFAIWYHFRQGVKMHPGTPKMQCKKCKKNAKKMQKNAKKCKFHMISFIKPPAAQKHHIILQESPIPSPDP